MNVVTTAAHARTRTRTRSREAPRPVPRVSAPSVAAFRDDFLAANRPVIITDVASRWPAITRWTPAYFREHAPGATVNVYAKSDSDEHGEKRTTAEECEIPLATLLDYVEGGIAPELCYARQVYLLDHPVFRHDVRAPGYLDAHGVTSQAWIGPAGTVTQLHWDPAHNLYAQIRGRKRWTLIAPEHAADASPYRIPTRLLRSGLERCPALCAGLRAIERARPADRDALRALIVRHLDVRQRKHLFNVLAGMNSHDIDVESAAARRVPRWEAVLEPGELLFVPFMWRHHVHSLAPSIALNWFHGPWERSAADVRAIIIDALSLHLSA